MTIVDQLIGAIRSGELENLREILSQEIAEGRAAVTDDNIHEALCQAARSDSVEACRLLWGKLSPRGKRMYFSAKFFRLHSPLHVAVIHCHFEVVRLFIKKFKWNINQKGAYLDKTPLCYTRRMEMARFLLENGANVNEGGKYGPLWIAADANSTEVARLLLVEYQANPNLNRRPKSEEQYESTKPWSPRNTDNAIMHGNAEILRMLLECGAFVGMHSQYSTGNGTRLNSLLRNGEKSNETKVAICRILIEHAREDHDTAEFLRVSLELAIQQTDNEGCQILLEARVEASTAILYRAFHFAIRVENITVCQLLVREYHVDPFLQEHEHANEDEDRAASPFLAAARLPDTRLLEYFLGEWDERFLSTGGKNGDGDYPLHVVCCDPHVSLQAIQLLVHRHADTLAVVDGEQGLLPFHFAANWGASLDVIFYLLQHCPDALSHVGNAAGVPHPSLLAMDETTLSTSSSTNTTTVATLGNNDDIPPKKKAKTTR